MLGRKDVNLSVALLASLLLQRRYTEVLVETVSSSLGSNDVRLLLIQGEAQMGLGQYEKSLQMFTRALELEPDSVPALLAMVRISLAREELEAADGYLARAQQLETGHEETRVLAGRIALARAGFESAREKYGASDELGLAPEIYLGVAQSFLAEGRPDAGQRATRGAEKHGRTCGRATLSNRSCDDSEGGVVQRQNRIARPAKGFSRSH